MPETTLHVTRLSVLKFELKDNPILKIRLDIDTPLADQLCLR